MRVGEQTAIVCIFALGVNRRRPLRCDGGERRFLFSSVARPVDLVFTDIIMPGHLDGYGLAMLVRERWPGRKVLLTCGLPRRANSSLRRPGPGSSVA